MTSDDVPVDVRVREMLVWLVRIAELRDLEILSDAEFTHLKSELVGSLRAAVRERCACGCGN